MTSSLFVRKTRVIAFLVFLWMSIACIYVPSSASAAPTVLQEGFTVGCDWKYERIGNEIVLTIAPSRTGNREVGSHLSALTTLSGDLRENFLDWVAFNSIPDWRWTYDMNRLLRGWHNSEHKKNTKRVVVKNGVRVREVADFMFYDFENVESFDLRGLKLIKGISRHDRISTKGMFFGCRSVVSLDLGGLNQVVAADMEKMFSGCSKLASLNLGGWRASNANTQDLSPACNVPSKTRTMAVTPRYESNHESQCGLVTTLTQPLLATALSK